jgi:chromosome segregation ATPase
MRLLSLEVEHFGPIRSATLELCPGLNVLYGPNDIGKSHLAEALRAVLLLVPSSVRHEAYVPWGSDVTPEVTLAFQTDATQRWRVRKTFGTGTKGTALLERATGDGAFHTEAKGREVEGRLRALLRWGVQPPGTGGKRGASGLPETYLSRLLIGRQAEVSAIFGASLADDPEDSGKQRLTEALHALAQDPLFGKVLARTQDKVNQAFSAGGGHRRAKDSPLVRVREEVRTAEQRLTDLRQQAAGGASLQSQLAQLLAERTAEAERVAEAQGRLAQVRESHARAQARRAAGGEVDEARRALDAVRATHQAATTKATELESLRAALTVADAEHARARTHVLEAQRGVRTAEERLEAVKAERAGAVQLRRQTLETRRVELEGARADASRRADAARKVGALANDADARTREHDGAREDVARLEASAAQAEATFRLATARRAELEGRRLAGDAAEAEGALATTRADLERATAALSAASAALEQAEARQTEARERLQRAQSEDGAQQRALKEEELARRRLEAQAACERADAEAGRARAAGAAAERAATLARALEDRRADERQAATSVSAAEDALSIAQAESERLQLAGAYLEWRAASTRLEEAERAAAELAALHDQTAAVRRQADVLEAELAMRPLPDSALLGPFRALERELGAAEARLDVGVSVLVTARQGFELGEAVDGAPPDTTVAEPGDELECSARQQLRLTIGDVAELTIRGGRPQDRQVADQLRERWRLEVEPVLAAARAPDLVAVEALVREAAERRAQVASLRQQAAALVVQVDRLGDVAGQVEGARHTVGERLAALDGSDPAALEKDAAGLGLLAPAGPLFSSPKTAVRSPAATLEARRSAAEDRIARARTALEAVRVERGQAALRVETATRDVEEARLAEATLAAALGAPSDEVLRRAEAAKGAAKAALAAVEHEHASLANEQSTALADARDALQKAEVARSNARRACDDARGAREAAHAVVSVAEAQLQVKRQAAASVDLPALEKVRREREQELVQVGGAPTGSDTAPTAADLVRFERAATTAREALSTARASLAGREAARVAAVASLDGAAKDLGADWKVALPAAESSLTSATSELAGVTAELTSLEQRRDEAIEAARRDLTTASARLADAETQEQARAQGREGAKAAVDMAQGQLGALQELAARHDLVAAEAAVAGRQAHHDGLPAPDATLAHDDATLQANEQAASEVAQALDRANLAVNRLQGQIEITGGAVIQERIKDAEDSLERLRQREAEVELDYAAWKLLGDVLVEAEARQQTHLGEKLVGPVSRRFRELTRASYGPLALGPDLETAGISVAGALRTVDALSVGTRDQLSAILRLTVAAQLESTLVLDDQLAQSDPGRLDWFSNLLREIARETQVLVLTCRPGDYLAPAEFPDAGSSSRGATDGRLRAIDLQRVQLRVHEPDMSPTPDVRGVDG